MATTYTLNAAALEAILNGVSNMNGFAPVQAAKAAPAPLPTPALQQP